MACVNELIDDVRALVKPQLKPDTILEFDAVSVPGFAAIRSRFRPCCVTC